MSWDGLVINPECADTYVVKYWPEGAINGVHGLSDITSRWERNVTIRVDPGEFYYIQAIARENKGGVLILEFVILINFDMTTMTASPIYPRVHSSRGNRLEQISRRHLPDLARRAPDIDKLG